jgi:GTPase-associated system helical domain
MSVNSSFADWYRSAAIVLPEGTLEKRWAGVEALADGINREWIVYLATLFARADLPSAAHDQLRKIFKDKDENFPYKENLEELRVLAGAALHHIIALDGTYSMLAALAIVCGSFGRRLVPEVTADHLEAARRYLAARASADRQGDKVDLDTLNEITSETLSKLLPQQHFTSNQLPSTYPQIIATFSEIVAQQAKLQSGLRSLARTLIVRGEEIDLLWWLQAEYSRTLEKSFSEIACSAGSLVLSSEVADLTATVPGSPSLIGILIRALQRTKGFSLSAGQTLSDTVNASPRGWREAVRGKHDFSRYGSLCPVNLAIAKSLDTDGADEWQPVFRKLCSISLQQAFPIIEIALQMYNERMLDAAWLESA